MNELKINGFSAVAEEEMMAVDGGGIWKGILAAVGAVAGIVIACVPGGAAIEAIVAAGVAGATGGVTIGGIIEDGFNS